MPRKTQEPGRPRNRSSDAYDTEYEAEILGTPLSDGDQKAVAVQRSQRDAYAPVVVAALGCVLESLPNHPDYWRINILGLLPEIPTVSNPAITLWLKDGVPDGVTNPDKLDILKEEALMEQMMRIHGKLNTAVPQSAFYHILEKKKKKDARRKREEASKVKEQEFRAGHPVFYLDKRSIAITRYPEGFGEVLREALAMPIESATLPRLKSLYIRQQKAKTQAAEGGSLEEVKSNASGKMKG